MPLSPAKIDLDSELSGVRKAAILMLALEQEAAATILKQMEPKAVEEITRELAALGEIDKAVRDKVFQEFYSLALASGAVREGGLDYAKSLLGRSMDSKDAERILQQISQQVRKTPFAFLQKAESQNLLTFIQEEH